MPKRNSKSPMAYFREYRIPISEKLLKINWSFNLSQGPNDISVVVFLIWQEFWMNPKIKLILQFCDIAEITEFCSWVTKLPNSSNLPFNGLHNISRYFLQYQVKFTCIRTWSLLSVWQTMKIIHITLRHFLQYQVKVYMHMHLIIYTWVADYEDLSRRIVLKQLWLPVS